MLQAMRTEGRARLLVPATLVAIAALFASVSSPRPADAQAGTIVLDGTTRTRDYTGARTITGETAVELGFYFDLLLVGGGGAGGVSAGGGAGGFCEYFGNAAGTAQGALRLPDSRNSTNATSTNSVIVGAAGLGPMDVGVAEYLSRSGGNSTFPVHPESNFSIHGTNIRLAPGGGGGGAHSGQLAGTNNTRAGGSGSGGVGAFGPYVMVNGRGGGVHPIVTGDPNCFGHPGGDAVASTTQAPNTGHGGGGGAGGPGGRPFISGPLVAGAIGDWRSGAGGPGRQSALTGARYAGGGGGGGMQVRVCEFVQWRNVCSNVTVWANDGRDGGGRGQDRRGASTRGAANTGGGGGAGASEQLSRWGQSGGSGIVVVRVPGSTDDTGISASNRNRVVTSGNNRLHFFHGNGSFSVNLQERLRVVHSGAIGGSGSLVFEGPGRLVLNNANTYSGVTRSRNTRATLEIGHEDALRRSTLDMNGSDSGAVVFAGSGREYRMIGIQGSRNLALGGNTLHMIPDAGITRTYTGALSNGSLRKSGPGTQVLTNASQSYGTTRIDAGTLQIGNGASGRLGTGAVTNDASLVFDRTGTLVLESANVIGGSGELIKRGSGAVEIQANNSYTGRTVVEAGTLRVGRASGAGSLGAATQVEVRSGATLVLDRSNALTVGDVLSGAGTLRKRAAGTTTLTAQSPNFTGPVAVEAGRLLVEGRLGGGAVSVGANTTLGGSGRVGGPTTFASSARHTPGSSTGVQTFDGDVTYQNGSRFVFELTGNKDNTTDGTAGDEATDRGGLYDGVDVGGRLTFGSTAASDLVFNTSGSAVRWSDDFWSQSRRWRVFTAGGGVDASFDVFGTITVSADGAGVALTTARPGSFFRWQVVDNDVFLVYRAPVADIELTVVPDDDAALVAALAAGALVEEVDWRVRNGVLTFYKEQPDVKAFAIGRSALQKHLSSNLTIPLATFQGAQPLTLGSGATLTLDQSATSTYTGVLSGAGALTKRGAGALTLEGASTFTGAARVEQGVLVAGISTSGAAGALSSGPFGRGTVTVVTGATLEIAGRTVGNALSIDGAGAVTAGKAGAVAATGATGTLTGMVTLTGAATVASTGDGEGTGLVVSGTVTGAHAATLRSASTLTVSGTVSTTALLLRDTPSLAFGGATFSVNTLAATGVGPLTLTNTKALTIGTVGGVNGVSSSGPVAIRTKVGDLNVTQPVATTHADVDEVGLTLQAGADTAFGRSEGGNVRVTGSGAVTAAGTRIEVFSATARDSAGLPTALPDARVNVAPPERGVGVVAVAYRTGPPVFSSPTTLVFGQALTVAADDFTDGAGGGIAYTLVSGAGCRLEGVELGAIGMGTCVVRATNRDFTTDKTVTIQKAQQQVTFTSPVGTTQLTVDARSTAPLTGTSTSGGPVTFSVTEQTPVTTGDTVCTLSGAVLTFIREGTCTVRANQAGNTFYEPGHAEVTLTVLPIVPGRASITSVSAGDLRIVVGLRAPADDGGSPLLRYDIEATRTDGSVDPIVFECADATSPCVVEGTVDGEGSASIITNSVDYRVRARAVNRIGAGAWTDLSPTVRPVGRPNAVRDLTTRPDDGTLTANWEAPEGLDVESFLHYAVSLRSYTEVDGDLVPGDWGTPVLLTAADARAYTFEGLANGTIYDVQIVVVVTGDEGDLESRTMIASGVPARLPGVPRDLTLTSLTRTSVLASWSAPSDDGGSPITGYDVSPVCTGEAGETFCVIDGLAAGAVVSVAAVNLVGEGPKATLLFRPAIDDADITLVAAGEPAGVEGRDWMVVGGELLVFQPESGKAVSIRGPALQAHLTAGSVSVKAATLAGSEALEVAFQRMLTLDLSDASTYAGALSGVGTFVKQGAGTLTLSGSSTLTGATTVEAGRLVVGATLGTGTVTVDAGATLELTVDGTFANVVDGAGSLVRSGSGATVLTGAHAYTGTTTVAAGTLTVGAGGTSGSLPSGAVTVASGATLTFDRSDDVTVSNVIGGAGALTQAGAGRLTLTGTSTYTGATTVTAGTLTVDGALGATAVTVANGAVLTGSGTISGPVVASSGGTHAPGSPVGVQTLTGGVTYQAGSTFRFALTGNTTDGRGTTYDGVDITGELTVQLGATSELVFDAGSTVDWEDEFWDKSRRWKVFSATSVDASALVFSTVTLTPDSKGKTLAEARPGSFFRWEVIDGDVFLLFRSSVLGVALTIVADDAGAAGGGVLGVEGRDWRVEGGQIAFFMEGEGRALSIRRSELQAKLDAGDLTVTVASLAGSEPLVLGTEGSPRTLTVAQSGGSTYAGVLSGAGSVVKQGGGTLTLTADSTFTGTTTVTGGTLKVGAGGTTGSLPSGAITVGAGGTLAFDRSDAVTVANAIGGAGSLEQRGEGTLTLTGAGSGTVTTTIAPNRTLRVGDGGTSGSLPSGAVTVGEGATLHFDRSDAIAVSNAIGGAGAVTKVGSNRLTLTGTSTYTGATTVSAGTLTVNGMLGATAVTVADGAVLTGSGTIGGAVVAASGARHAPGAPVGVQTLAGGVTYQAGSTFRFALTGNTNANGDRGSVYGGVDVTGTLTIGSGVTAELDFGTGVTWSDPFWDQSRRWKVFSGATSVTAPVGVFTSVEFPEDSTETALNVARVGSSFRWIVEAGDVFLLYGAPALDAQLTIVDGPVTNAPGATWQFVSGELVIFFEGDGRDIRIPRALIQAELDKGPLTMRVATLEGTAPLTLGKDAVEPVATDGDTPAVEGAPATASTLTLVQSGDSTYGGVLSGIGALVKQGPGTLRLAGANTYTGTTSVEAGGVQAGAGGTTGTLGSGPVTVAEGATLAFDRTDTFEFGGAVSGAGAVVQRGTGAVTLTGALTHTGGTSVEVGTLTVGDGDTDGTLAGDVTVAADATLAFNRSDTVTFAGDVSGAGAVRQSGTGTLTLTGASTFTGGTSITGGVLVAGGSTLGQADALTSGPFGTGTLTVQDGATLDLDGKTVANALSVTGTGTTGAAGAVVSGAGGVLAGAVTLTGAATLAATGPFTLGDVTGAHPLVIDATGGNVTLAGAIGTGAQFTLRSTSPGRSVTATEEASLTVDGLLADGVASVALAGAGDVSLGTLATRGVGALHVRSTGPLTVGTVGGVVGVSAYGLVVLETTTGDLNVIEPVTTTLTLDGAGLVLRAGSASALGSLAGGDVKVTGDGQLTAILTRIHVFSGSAGATTLAPAPAASQVGTTPPEVEVGQVAVAYRTGPPVFTSPSTVAFRTTITLAAADGTAGGSGAIVYAFVSGDDKCTFDATDPSAPIVRGIGIGTCVVSATNADFTTEQTITVGPTTQMVTFTSPVPATATTGEVGTTAALSAIASSGLTTFTFSSTTTTPAVCSVSGTVVSFLAVGVCTLVATQPGDAFYQASSTTVPVTVEPGQPGAPSITSVSSGDRGITVGFRAPSEDGGAPITGYRIIVTGPGGPYTFDCASIVSPCVFPENAFGDEAAEAQGKEFIVTIAARNSPDDAAAGKERFGEYSAPSPAVTVFGVPGVARSLTSEPDLTDPAGETLSVSWSPPADFGGREFVRYDVFLKKASDTAWPTEASTVVSKDDLQGSPDRIGTSFDSLENGVAYDVKVVVIVSSGEPPVEFASEPVIAQGVPIRPPSAPREVVFTPLARERVLVSWRSPVDDGGTPVTSYSVTATAGDLAVGAMCTLASATDRFCTLDGVGAADVVVNVAAVNLAGTGTSAVATYRPPLVAPQVTVVASGGDVQGVDWFVLGGELLVMPGGSTGRAGDAVAVGRAALQLFLDAADLRLQVATLAGVEALVVPFERTLAVAQSGASAYEGVLSGEGTLRKQDGGTLTLAAASTLSGPTTIVAGSLVVGVALGTGPVTVGAGATLGLTVDGTFANVVDGGGSLVRSGSGTTVLTGAHTYTGTTTVEGGTLTVGAGGTSGSLPSGAVTVTSGATLTFDRSDDVTVSNVLSGAGALRQAGPGTLTLDAQSPGFSGTVTAIAGSLVVEGEVPAATVRIAPAVEDDVAGLGGSGRVGGTALASGAVHSPGSSTGIQTFPSGLTYETGSTFRFELTGNTNADGVRGTAYDGVDVGGTLTVQSGVTAELVFNATGSGVTWGDPFWNESRRWKVFSGATSVVASDSVFATVTASVDSGGATLAAARPRAFFRWEVVGNDVFLLYRAPVTDAQLTIVADDADAADGGVLGVEGLDWKVEGGQLVVYMQGAGRAMSIARGALQAKLAVGDLTVSVASFAGSEPLVLGAVGSPRTLTVAQSGGSTYAGVLSGSGSVVKQGAGTLTLTAASTYTGTTTVAGGTLQVGAGGTSGSLPSGAVTVSESGTLVFDRSDDVTVGNAISGAGDLRKRGEGVVTLTGASTLAGPTTVAEGTLVVAGTLGTSAVTVAAAATLELTVDGTFANVVDGAGQLVRSGAGSTVLSGSSTLTGSTTVTSGRLVIAGTLGTGGVTVAAAATLELTVDGTFANALSGSGALVRSGAGTTVLTGANTSTGTTTVTGGTLQVGAGGTAGSLPSGAVTITAGATLVFERTDASTVDQVIAGAGTLVQRGAGAVALTAMNTLTGNVEVEASRTLVLAGGGTLGTAAVTLAADALLRVDTSGPVTLPNAVAGDGALEKVGVGALTLNAASTYAGGTTVTAGTLAAGASSTGAAGSVTSGPFGTGAVSVDGGATLDLAGRTVTNAVSATGTGVTGSGGAVVSGGADLGTLAGPLTLTGATTVRSTGAGGIALTGGVAGVHVLTVGAAGDTGPVTLGGTVAVAGPLVVRAGTIDLTGTIDIAGTGRLELVTSAAGTITGSGSAVITVDELLVRGGSQVLLVAPTMDVTTFAATSVTDLSAVFADGVTIGTVDGVAGVAASGVVDLRTVAGNLDVAAPVSSTLAALTPGVVLRAGTASPVGTATGGDVRIQTGGSIVATDAVVEVFSGTAGASTGIDGIATASRVGTSVPPVSPGQVGIAYRSGPPVFLSGGTLVFGDVLRVLATDGTGVDPTITLKEGSGAGVCDLSFGTLTAVGVGECVIVAANASFATEQTVTVAKAPQTIVFTSIVPSNVSAITVYRPVAVSSVTIAPDEPEDVEPPDTGGLVGMPGDGRVMLAWESLATFEDPGSGETRTTTGYLIRLGGEVVCMIETPEGADDSFLLPTTCAVTGLTNGETFEFDLEAVAGIDSRRFAPVAVTLPDPDAPPEAVVLPVAFAIVEGGVDADGDGPVCELEGGAVRFLRAGTCTVEATQPGDDNYEAAVPVRQTLVAGLINRTIRFPVLRTVVLGQPPFLAGADVTTGPAPTFTTSDGSVGVCTVGATTGLVTLVGVGTCTITASSAGDARFTTPDPVTRTFVVQPAPPGVTNLTSVSPGNGSVTVGFILPGNDGGARIETVRLRAFPDDGSGAVIVECLPVSPCTIEGLVNGTTYTVDALSVNSAGAGAPSPRSPAVMPFAAPDAVRALRMTAGDGLLDVGWEAPTSFGGGTFQRYEVSVRAYGPSDDPDDDGAEVAGEWSDPIVLDSVSARTARFEELANGVRYDVKVVVISTVNTEELTSNTAIASGVPVSVPSAPEELSLTRIGPDSVLATWGVPASDGGAPITGYTVSPSCTLESPTATSCVITRLPRGMEVTVAVRAVNRVGPSEPGLAVITLPAPPAPPAPPGEEDVSGTTVPGTRLPAPRPGPSAPDAADRTGASTPTMPVPFPGGSLPPGEAPRVIVEGGSELDTMPGRRLSLILVVLILLAGSAFFLIAWRRRDDDEEEEDGQGTEDAPPSADGAQAPDEQDRPPAPPR